jgi:hypothetical protein
MDWRTLSAANLNSRLSTFFAVCILSFSTVGIRQTLPYASLDLYLLFGDVEIQSTWRKEPSPYGSARNETRWYKSGTQKSPTFSCYGSD